MPDIDGIELIGLIHAEFPEVPIVAVSGFMRGQMLTAAKYLGSTEVLSKDIADNLLIPTICKVIDRWTEVSGWNV